MPDESNICMVHIASARLAGVEERLTAADVGVHKKDSEMMFFINESRLRRPVDQLLKVFVV
ncbi:MAG: hypothetical protein ABIQ70_00010 [Dokdonella sp.]